MVDWRTWVLAGIGVAAFWIIVLARDKRKMKQSVHKGKKDAGDN